MISLNEHAHAVFATAERGGRASAGGGVEAGQRRDGPRRGRRGRRLAGGGPPVLRGVSGRAGGRPVPPARPRRSHAPGRRGERPPPRARLHGFAVRRLGAQRARHRDVEEVLRHGLGTGQGAVSGRPDLRRHRLPRSGDGGRADAGGEPPAVRRRWRPGSPASAASPPSAWSCSSRRPPASSGSVQIAARIVETGLHKMHEVGFDIHTVRSGFGSCPLAPVAGRRPHGHRPHQRRGPLRRPCLVHRRDGRRAHRARDRGVCRRPPRATTARRSAELFRRYGGDFYKIDPLLFSPAEITITNSRERQDLPRRRRQHRRPSRFVVRVKVAILGQNGGWHTESLRAAHSRGAVSSAECYPVTQLTAQGDRQAAPDGGDGARSTTATSCSCAPSRRGRWSRWSTAWTPCACSSTTASGWSIRRAPSSTASTSTTRRRGCTTRACRRRARWSPNASRRRMAAYEELGGDVVVKPLFGSEGRGIVRVSRHRHRVPRVPRPRARPLHLLPAGVRAARPRGHPRLRGRGARHRRHAAPRAGVEDERRPGRQGGTDSSWTSIFVDLSLRATRVVGAEHAGVDILPCEDGGYTSSR